MERIGCGGCMGMLLALLGLLGAALLAPARGLAWQNEAPRAPVAGQKLDAGYTKKIRDYTTEKFFLTELVDHLPASETVPSPEKVIGYPVGTPDRLTYTREIHAYFAALEKASPRVRVFSLGRSEEGRDTLLVAISDEANLRNLDRLREITARLADPRAIRDEAEADRLIAEGKPFYWAVGGLHSTEAGSPEMLMEMAYRLAVSDMPAIQEIRRDTVVLLTPVLEVDGRDRYVDLYRWRKANPDRAAPPLLYWGRYVAHDNNGDQLSLSLALSRNMMAGFLRWHPTVLHDLHESVPFLYTSTGTGPYNAWLDPIVIDEWHRLAYHEIEEMTKRGVPGVWTHGFYDGWAPNYMFYVANGHNSIGRFYETYGGIGADTRERTVGAQSTRTWYRPNPPLPRVRWSLRNNVNLSQSALLMAMNMVAREKERFLRNFYLKGRRSIAKAHNEGPAAWVIPADEPRAGNAAELVKLLQLQGIEVHTAQADFSVPAGAVGGPNAPPLPSPAGAGERPDAKTPWRFPKGSYLIRMDQPYSRMADLMLDTQFYNVSDPRPYDDTGWSLGPLKNVRTARITDPAVLKVPAALLTGAPRPRGGISGSAAPGPPAAYLIQHNADNRLATLRFRLKDVPMHAAETAFRVGDREYPPGTFLIRSAEAPRDLRARLEQEAAALGIPVTALRTVPEVNTHPLAVPRIAILHTWQNTQNEGWFRLAFESLEIPYDYISDHDIRDTPDLKAKYDVILFPPVGGSAQSIVRGLPMHGDPIPWTGSELTPNIGKSPDTTDDIRGGMGLRGMLHLQKFLEAGGLFIPITTTAAVPIEFGLTEGITIGPAEQLQARGSIYRARFSDRRSPVAYGYDPALAVYFNQAPLFQVSSFGGSGSRGRGDAGPGGTRPSGRGTLADPDVPQGRPQAPPPPPPPAARPGEEPPLSDEMREALRGRLPPLHMRPRVILRFAPETELLVSGMLAGASELANRPAVVDVPVGKGHVLFFAINPMWRQQTQGSFFLIFNAALNYRHLDAGRPQPRRGGS